MKRSLTGGLLIFLLLTGSPYAQAQGKIVIKLGTVAPEGSTYMDIAHALEQAIERRSGGKVEVKWYPGGVLGDEPAMIRLMRIGQLHGAGLSGMGLGLIDINVRAVELPLLFKNYNEVDAVLKELFPYFKDAVMKRGVVLTGIAENGFVYFFGKEPIVKVEDIKGYKMWVWAADQYAIEAFKALPGILAIPLPITDTLTALQTGIVDGFYNTPLAAVALGWTSRVKYMLDIPVVYGSAWFVFEKKFFDSLPEDIKTIIMEESKRHFTLIRKQARQDNDKAIDAIKKSGIKILKPAPEDMKRFKELGIKAREKVVGKIISREVYEKILNILKGKRGGGS